MQIRREVRTAGPYRTKVPIDKGKRIMCPVQHGNRSTGRSHAFDGNGVLGAENRENTPEETSRTEDWNARIGLTCRRGGKRRRQNRRQAAGDTELGDSTSVPYPGRSTTKRLPIDWNTSGRTTGASADPFVKSASRSVRRSSHRPLRCRSARSRRRGARRAQERFRPCRTRCPRRSDGRESRRPCNT